MIPIAVASLACGKDPSGPSRAEIQGSYTATTILAWDTGDYVVSAADLGATITIALGSNGALVYLPASARSEDVDFSLDLAGTWALQGDSIVLHPGHTSFFDNATFHWQADTIRGDVIERHEALPDCPCRYWYAFEMARTSP